MATTTMLVLGVPSAMTLLLIAARSVLKMIFARKYTVHPGAEGGGVLITGTSTGIGQAATVALFQRGYTVFAGVRKDKDKAKWKEYADEKKRGGGQGHVIPVIMDVADDTSVERGMEEISSYLKSNNITLVGVVNNAGISKGLPIELEDMKTVNKVFQVNAIGVIRVCRACIPILRQSKGRIINISSVQGRIAGRRGGTYAATKHAVEAITDTLRLELATWGISVSAIQPAYVKTSHAQKSLGDNLPWKDLPEESYALYRQLFDTYPAKRAKHERLASSTDVTTRAIVHALTSPYPRTRYPVSNVGRLPASVVLWARWVLPDRVFDAVRGSN